MTSPPSHKQKPLTDDVSLPRQFGRLMLLKKMARGGMGEVFLATTRGIEGAERPCVVKTIRREHANDKSFRARFLDETRVQAQLQHPAVAQILEANESDDGAPYAVVEYVEGRHLGEILGRSHSLGTRVAWPEAVALGLSFAEALAHIHERCDARGRALEISHRDLSPQNLMISYAGDVKLIDFGTARGENRRCRTVTGVVYAKPGYVAPEVANQIPGGSQADLYAFGVILWEALAGRRFLQGDVVEHQALVAQGKKYLPAIADEIEAPKELDEILARLTATSLVQRYATAREASSDLIEVLKRAHSLANGERSVRGRLQQLMQVLYPAEPARSRADFSRLVTQGKERLSGSRPTSTGSLRPDIPQPSPAAPEVELAGLLGGTRYRLDQKVSLSAMGEVYQATHMDLGRKVALKLLPPGSSRSAEARLRFRAEARALARLEHPGLVRIFEYGLSSDSRCYYAMEWLEGETLLKKLEAGPLEKNQAAKIMLQVSRALEVAHSSGIIHRDITPANIFITDEGTAKILDFGVCLTESREPSLGLEESQPEVVGTPEYIAPEQASGAQPDCRSDLYSLGAVFYECLTGRLPHAFSDENTGNLAALLTAKISKVPPVPSSLLKEKGLVYFDRLVLRLLQRDASRRPQSAKEASAQLEELLQRPTHFWTDFTQNLQLPKIAVEKRALLLSALTLGTLIVLLGIFSLRWSGTASSEENFSAELESVPAQSLALGALQEDLGKLDQAAAAVHLKKPPLTAQAQSQVRRASPYEEQVKLSLRLLQQKQRIKAHHQLKQLSVEAPNDLVVWTALIQSARSVKAWGEALNAARKAVKLRGSAHDYIELAKLQRATTLGDPIASLKKALEIEPQHLRAQRLLQRYLGSKLASR